MWIQLIGPSSLPTVAIANKTPASLQTVYCGVPVRALARESESWRASPRPIADLFFVSAACGPGATWDLAVD